MDRFFNQIKIRTPESVELEFTLAGIGNRALALLIDYTVLGAAIAILVLLASLIAEQLTDLATLLGGGTEAIELWLAAILLLVLFAVFVCYFVFFEVTWQGQSPGKRFAKIRVIQENGRPPGLFQATLRSLLRPVDDILFLGFFLIVLTKREKRLGDWLAGTLVVQNEQTASTKGLQTSTAADQIARQLLELADLSQLTPDDFLIIRAYLARRTQLNKNAKSQISLQLARQAKQIIQLETLPADMSPDVFLEAVYLGYQQQTEQR
ncbi:MAG: RDD family protein [Thainema sp.]